MIRPLNNLVCLFSLLVMQAKPYSGGDRSERRDSRGGRGDRRDGRGRGRGGKGGRGSGRGRGGAKKPQGFNAQDEAAFPSL